jgi:hypothetical protein
MTDASDRLLAALEELDRVASEATPEEAVDAFDEPTLQVFWQRWPQVSSWAGSLWRRLNETLEDAAMPVEDPDLHEVGGEGG